MASRFLAKIDARPLAKPNLTPLIGVLLAVFAVVTATAAGLGKPANIYVEPGSVPPPPGAPVAKMIVVSLERDGGVVFEQEHFDRIDAALARAGREARVRGHGGVTLRADPEVPYSRVAQAVRILNRAGLQAQFID